MQTDRFGLKPCHCRYNHFGARETEMPGEALRAHSIIRKSMRYKYEDKLRQKARAFMRALEQAGFSGALAEDSLREYSVKVSVASGAGDHGNAVIYYSPRSDSFTLNTRELKDESVATQLESCWHGGKIPDRDVEARDAKGIEIYVDGSFINGATGYGVVILKDGRVVEELSGAVTDASVAYARQVAGELFAVEEALRWCRRNSVQEATIYYDYYGIEKWATGRWKANQELTQKYRDAVRASCVEVKWRKVASHTGNRWNDRADHLAKKGAGASGRIAPDDDSKNDLIIELLEASERFIEFLMVRGVEACLDRTYNDQFARLLIVEEDERIGLFDLYNTKKKPLAPYLHAFKDEEVKLRLETLWKEFKRQAASI